jgi:hypothetical protein
MEDFIELEKTTTVVSELTKYKKGSFAYRKLKQAEETLARYGLPEEVANKEAEKGIKYNFWTTGSLVQADAKENTFSLRVKTSDKLTENTYIISTSSETLAKIVKQFWGENIRVFLRPKAIIGQPFYYDLIEIEEK